MNVFKKITGFVGGAIPAISGLYGTLILKLSGLVVALAAKLTGVMVNSEFFRKIGSFFGKIFGSLKKYIFKQRFVTLLSYILYFATLALAFVQVGAIVKNGIDLKDDYIYAFGAGNAEAITAAVIAAICVLAIIVQGILSLVAFFKEGKKIKTGFVSALIITYITSLYFKTALNEALAVSVFGGMKLFKPAMIVWAVFAVIRLMRKDFKKRLMLVLFALAGLIIVAAFGTGFGTFAEYSVLSEISFSASSVNPIEFIRCFITFFKGEAVTGTGYESLIFSSSLYTDKGWGIPSSAVAVILNFGLAFLCGLLPFLWLSLAAKFCGVMTAEGAEQYYLLQKSIKCARTTLFAAILASVFAIVAANVFGDFGETLSLTVNGGKIAAALILSVLLLVLTDLPWRISLSESFKKSVKEAF